MGLRRRRQPEATETQSAQNELLQGMRVGSGRVEVREWIAL